MFGKNRVKGRPVNKKNLLPLTQGLNFICFRSFFNVMACNIAQTNLIDELFVWYNYIVNQF